MFQGKPALPSRRNPSVPAGLFTIFLLLFIICTRWASAPQRLYYFDSANFALSLEHFNPALHEPQPPGYPLFVLLIRLIHFWVARPERVLLIAGLLAAAAATVLIRALASDMFGRNAGLLAAALLASNPVFWFAGITNQIRLCLAMSTLGIALLGWRALREPERPRWFYAACAAFGIAGGFRPVDAVLLVPLLLWIWFRTGRSLHRLLVGAALTMAVALPWVVVTVVASGGPAATLSMLWSYANGQFQSSSALFGAPAHSAWHMFQEAVVWTFLGVPAWIWAVPFVVRRVTAREKYDALIFLAVAFAAPFLFSAFVHIGDPDQALASISILCVAGGAVLAVKAGGQPLRMASAVVVLQVLLFFVPPSKLAKASSYRAVQAVDRMNRNALTAVEALRRKGPVTIVHYGSSVASRHLDYYFPEDYLVILPGSPGQPAPDEAIQMFYRHSGLDNPKPGTGLLTPHSHRVVCLLPFQAKPSDLPGWHVLGSVYYIDRDSDGPLTIGPYTLIPEAR